MKTMQLTLETKRIGRTKDGFVLIDFLLSASESQTIDPEKIWLMQGKDSKVINGLFLSNQSVDVKSPVQIVITISQKNLVSDCPATIEIKGQSTLKLDLPVEVLWRK